MMLFGYEKARYMAVLGFAVHRKETEQSPWASSELIETMIPDKDPPAPGFSMASLYRTLRDMAEEGVITKNSITPTDGQVGRPPEFYEITEPGQNIVRDVAPYVLIMMVELPEETQAILRLHGFTQPSKPFIVDQKLNSSQDGFRQ